MYIYIASDQSMTGVGPVAFNNANTCGSTQPIEAQGRFTENNKMSFLAQIDSRSNGMVTSL